MHTANVAGKVSVTRHSRGREADRQHAICMLWLLVLYCTEVWYVTGMLLVIKYAQAIHGLVGKLCASMHRPVSPAC